MKILTIFDTFGFFFRLYYAMRNLKSKDGKPSGMISGFANFIDNLKNKFQSDYVIFALDSKGKTFRSQIDPNYKTNRTKPDDDFLSQLPVCIEMFEKMELLSISKEGFEADDVIASLVKFCKDKDIFIRIVTSDKDLYQLIEDGKVEIFSPSKKILFNSNGCFEKYGVKPEQIRDFLAICGDSSDNIPGVKGIGEKGAKRLLENFGNLENIYENLDKIPDKRSQELLKNSKENAFLSQKLATLYDKLEFDEYILQKAIFPQENPLLKIKDILQDYSLDRILKNLSQNNQKQNLNFQAICLKDDEALKQAILEIPQNAKIAFDTETTGLEKDAKIVGFSFCYDEKKAFYVPINHSYLGVSQVSFEAAKQAILAIFSHFIIGHNLKFDFNVTYVNFNINPPKNFADTMILAWLLDPSQKISMDELYKKYFNKETIKFEDLVKKGENFSSVEIDLATNYAAEDAYVTFKFYEKFTNLLEANLLKLANNVEFKMVEILRKMESCGIIANRRKFRIMVEENSIILRNLTEQIYQICGEQFNINSPKQLGYILFEKLKLPYQKKTKTGYSTDESVLTKLQGKNEIIDKLLEYREIFKLQNTYCEPLLHLSTKDKNSRIYTNFLQTGTATGRFSSKNPNLQNIPARKGKAIRECFESEFGFSLLSLDYSQIELRLLSHFSEDPAMIEAFLNGDDIHAKTASMIFGEINPQNRSIAKSINFGLIYGMGANKLSDQLGISKADAKNYINRYFAAFNTIENYIENLKQLAKNDGFVTTILGRKRYFDFSDASPLLLSNYEREAVNTKFQGSAADIIKLAMVEISRFLDDDVRMILQIHDELIFEIKDEKIDYFAKKFQDIMQNVIKLKVPLVCNFNIGKNWGDLK